MAPNREGRKQKSLILDSFVRSSDSNVVHKPAPQCISRLSLIEIVSNRFGDEADTKFETYRAIGVAFYVIFDPEHRLSEETLRIFYRNGSSYKPMDTMWFPSIQFGMTLWHGEYEREEDIWRRWCDRNGQVIPTGAEGIELPAENSGKTG